MVLLRPPWPTTVHHVKLGVRARHLQGCAHCFYQHDTSTAGDGTVRKQLKVIRLAACMVAFYTGKNRAHFNHHRVHCMITNAGQQLLTQHSGTELYRHHTTSTKAFHLAPSQEHPGTDLERRQHVDAPVERGEGHVQRHAVDAHVARARLQPHLRRAAPHGT